MQNQKYRQFLNYIGILFCSLAVLIEAMGISGYQPACTLRGSLLGFWGYFISRHQSRTASLLAVVYCSLFGLVIPVLNMQEQPIYSYGVLAVIILLVLSISALWVTLKYHRLIQSKVIWDHVILKSFLSLAYAVVIFLGPVYWLMGRVDALGDIGHYILVFYNLYIAMICVAVGLTFKGWLPFTKDLPVSFSMTPEFKPESKVLCTASSSEQEDLCLPSDHSINQSASEIKTVPKRIGGWLLLPAFGLLISPFYTVLLGYGEFSKELNELKLVLKDLLVEDQAYLMLLAVMLCAFALCYLGYQAFTICCFFKKKKITPKLMIILYLFEVVAGIIGCYHGDNLASDVKDLVRASVIFLIWGSYFMYSERVKDTFIK